jgi:hypothetical protein
MKFILTAAITLSVILGVFLFMRSSAVAIEKPDYTVEREDGKFQIRTYPPMLLAEVDVTGDRDTAANRGFRKLAGFIFGDNETQTGENTSTGKSSGKIAMTAPVVQTPKSTKIDMTSPVVQTPNAEGKWTVNFMMPSEYSLETLPTPTDKDIRIFMSAPYRSVSIRFSGRGTQSNLAKHEKRLSAWIAQQGLEIEGGPEYAFYDAPFIPPMFRRNEIHYRLKPTP